MSERELDNMTQSEVAALLQVSPQRVGQIERAALAKIRAAIATGEYPALAEENEGRLSKVLLWAEREKRQRDERTRRAEAERKRRAARDRA